MKCVLLVHFSSLEEENFHCCCDITSWGGGGEEGVSFIYRCSTCSRYYQIMFILNEAKFFDDLLFLMCTIPQIHLPSPHSPMFPYIQIFKED